MVEEQDRNYEGEDFRTCPDLAGATFTRCNFRNADFRSVNLDGAKFPDSNLVGANFEGASLRGADLSEARNVRAVRSLKKARCEGANLRGVDFSGLDLEDTRFQDASLQGANFVGTTNLSIEQLGGAHLLGTQLPECLLDFEGLDSVAASSRYFQTLFKIILALCSFSVLTVYSTPDSLLILPEASAGNTLPFLHASIAPRHFAWIAPLTITILFLYMLIYIGETWIQLSKLPAVFPDGTTLDRRAYPLTLLIGDN